MQEEKENSKSSAHGHHQEAESHDATRFKKSLQELRDLCSQLHHAADYCETTFLNTKQKRIVLDNTKEYICKAVVTVVDHLGCVSANLDCGLSNANSSSETEFRIDSLKQRLEMCQQYSHKLSLSKMCWRADFPTYHPRYMSPPLPDLHKPNEVSWESGGQVAVDTRNKHVPETEEEVPLLFYTSNCKPSLLKDSTIKVNGDKRDCCSAPVLPVRDGLSSLPKVRHPSFHFQETPRLKRSLSKWKSVQHNNIISLIRRGK